MFIEKTNHPGVYSYESIKQRFLRERDQLFCTKVGNKFIAIITPNYIKDPQPVIIYNEEVDVPLWKQSMKMQMGQKYQTKSNQRTSRRIQWLDEDMLNPSLRFEVYNFVSL